MQSYSLTQKLFPNNYACLKQCKIGTKDKTQDETYIAKSLSKPLMMHGFLVYRVFPRLCVLLKIW